MRARLLRLLPGSRTMARAMSMLAVLAVAALTLGLLAGVAGAGSSERQGTAGAA